MKTIAVVTASLISLAPVAALAQTANSDTGQSTSRMTSPNGSPGSSLNSGDTSAPAAGAQGRSAADTMPGASTTSGRPSDNTGTQSMAPSSGNSPSGEPDPGMGRGNK